MNIAKRHTVLICDDVRNELGNKLSIMGIYGPELWLGKIPAVMPKLCFVIMLHHIERSFSSAKARVTMPGADPAVLPIQAAPGPQPGAHHTIIVALAPAKIDKEGLARFEFLIADETTPQIVHEFYIRAKKPSQPVMLH